MTNPLVPQTKLDAVNQMLSSIGQAPVNSLDVTGIRDVSQAVLELDTQLRKVLTKGWSFNTDYDFPLTPDGNSNILIPASALHVDPCNPYTDYVERTNSGVRMLYDRKDRTFVIEDDVDCKVVWAFEFDEIPQHARSYIATKAARVWQAHVIGSQLLYQYTKEDELEAKITFMEMEESTEDSNMLTSPTEVNSVIYHRRTSSYR